MKSSQDLAPSRPCLNCGHEVRDRFCERCGQATREMRASLGAMLRELFGNVFNLDSTVMRSVRPLFFEPGALTLHFMEGRRAAFVRPVRLYLISSLFFFLAFGTILPKITEESSANIRAGVNKRGDEGKIVQFDSDTSSEEEAKKDPEALEKEQELDLLHFDMDALAARLERQGRKMEGMNTGEQLKMMMPHFVKATSKGLFLFLPLFAFILKLLYVRRDPYYFDHLIFALHFHSFLLLFLAGLIWWNYLEDASLAGVTIFAVLCVPPLYLYKSMRRVYGQSRLKTLVKFFILYGLYSLLMALLASAITVAALLMV